MHVNSFPIVLEGASKICLILSVFLRALCCIFSRVMLAGAGFVMLDRKCEHMHQTSSTYCA